MRYNSFNIIHKGLRAALYQTALLLQQTDFADNEQAEEAVNKVKEIIMLFEGHAHKEDNYVLPLINEYEPSVVTAFNSEHEEDGRLGNELNDAVQRVLTIESTIDKTIAGRELTESFVRFMVFNLNHMAKEEDIINKILWRYYSDDEIKAVVAKISQLDPPWIHEFYVTWMMRGISNTEAIEWMKAVERSAPAIAFKGLVQKAEQELTKDRFKKISASLTGELKVA